MQSWTSERKSKSRTSRVIDIQIELSRHCKCQESYSLLPINNGIYSISKFQVKIEFNGEKLIVKQSKLDHENHSTDQTTFDHYPENMKFSAEQELAIGKMLSVGANKKMLKLMKETGKPVMMKQLHNLQTKLQKAAHNGPGSDLQKLFDVLVTIPGAKVRFISNDDGEFVGNFVKQK